MGKGLASDAGVLLANLEDDGVDMSDVKNAALDVAEAGGGLSREL